MAATNGAFKLSAEFKRMLIATDNKHQRGQIKKIFIDGQSTKEAQARRSPRQKDAE